MFKNQKMYLSTIFNIIQFFYILPVNYDRAEKLIKVRYRDVSIWFDSIFFVLVPIFVIFGYESTFRRLECKRLKTGEF